MLEGRRHPMVELMRTLPAQGEAVSLARVVRQRIALAALNKSALLEPALDALLEAACRAASDGCDAPLAKVLEHTPKERSFLVRAGIGWQPGVVGRARAADDASNPAGEAFDRQRPVSVPDVRTRGDYHLPPIYPNHHIVSSSNVPIVGASGFYGVLEVDRREHRPFDTLDTSFLLGVAGILADAIERVRRQRHMQAALDARLLLEREHHHRVRNSYQSLIARLQRHAREAGTENSKSRFRDVERRIFALSALYDYLIGAEQGEGRIRIAPYLTDLCTRMRDFYGAEERAIELACDCPDTGLTYALETCTGLGIIVNELAANAIEHAFGPSGGRIEVRCRQDGNALTVTVADNGTGLPAARPRSVGLSVVDRLVREAGGSIAAESDGGTVWTIQLPIDDRDA